MINEQELESLHEGRARSYTQESAYHEIKRLTAEVTELREIRRAARFAAMNIVAEHIPGLVQRGHFERFRDFVLDSDSGRQRT